MKSESSSSTWSSTQRVKSWHSLGRPEKDFWELQDQEHLGYPRLETTAQDQSQCHKRCGLRLRQTAPPRQIHTSVSFFPWVLSHMESADRNGQPSHKACGDWDQILICFIITIISHESLRSSRKYQKAEQNCTNYRPPKKNMAAIVVPKIVIHSPE